MHEYHEANKKKIFSGNASKEAGTTGKGGISTAQRSVKRGYGIAKMDLCWGSLRAAEPEPWVWGNQKSPVARARATVPGWGRRRTRTLYA